MPPPEVLEDWRRGRSTPWPPAPAPPSDDELRFVMGQAVECCVGKGVWQPGTVVALWYSEAGFPPGFFAPYQIETDDGRLIFAPEDSNRCVRARAGAPAAPARKSKSPVRQQEW